jgi:hypothetical protein
MTPDSVIVVIDWVHHGCYIYYRLEVLDMCVVFFIIFR